MRVFKLKACPFCGGIPQVSSCVDYSVIFCTTCYVRSRENRVSMPTEYRIDALVKEWNERISSSKEFEHIHKEWSEN